MIQKTAHQPAVHDHGPSAERVTHPRGLLGIGESEYRAGRPMRALEPLLEACQRLEEAGDCAGQVEALLLAGRAARDLGRVDDADAYWAKALGLARLQGDESSEVEALNLRAGLLSLRGDELGALEILESALETARKADLPDRHAEILTNIGNLATRLGDTDRGIESLQEALDSINRSGTSSRTEAATLTNLGHLHRDLEELGAAQEYYSQAREVGRAIGDQMIEVVALNSLANILGRQGEWALARQLFHEALAMARSLGFRQYEVDNLDGLGESHAALGEHDRAVKTHMEAWKLARNIADASGQLDALLKVGHCLMNLDRTSEAVTFLTAALETARRAERRAELIGIHEALAVAHEELGDLENALLHQRQLRSVEVALLGEECERLAGQRAALHRLARTRRPDSVQPNE